MYILGIVLKNLWHQKVRTLLTVLGIGISIAAFVSLRGLTDNLERSIESSYKVRGADLIAMEKATLDIFASSIDQGYARWLKAIPHVNKVAPSLIYFYALRSKEYFMLFGWEYDSFLLEGLKVSGDGMKGDHDALLGFAAAKRLRKSIGDKIAIRGEEFLVRGIFESPSLIESGGIIVPLKTLQKIKKAEGKVTTISFRLDVDGSLRATDAQRQAVAGEVQDKVLTLFPDLEVRDIQDFASAPFAVIFSFTWAISLVVFLIVILAIANTMTTAVLERTKEIGILLAIGWRKRRIVQMVLLESGIYGLIGGIVGILFGYLMMKALLMFPVIASFVHLSYDPVLVARTLALAFFVGCLSGIYPAVRAVSLQPIKVLNNG